jgi:hypothetical protein
MSGQKQSRYQTTAVRLLPQGTRFHDARKALRRAPTSSYRPHCGSHRRPPESFRR